MQRLIAISLVLISAPGANAKPETVTVPIDQIWGYDLPGTRNIADIPLPDIELDQGAGQIYEKLRRERSHNIEQIRRAIAAKPPKEKASPGFVLQRQHDFYILRAVRRELVRDTRLREEVGSSSSAFPADADITLSFFSYPTSYYMRLKEVKREENEITVDYQFEPHATQEVTVHFALIPLGKLSAGDYHVHFKQVPMDQKFREAGFEPVDTEATEIVCRDFSFTIFEPPVEEPAGKDAQLIPLNRIWTYEMPGTLNVRALESRQRPGEVWRLDQSPLAFDIFKKLQRFPKAADEAGKAFVVRGTGKEALKNAHAVFMKQEKPATEFQSDDDLTLVFYSFVYGKYVWIDSVERYPDAINVKYRFISHSTAEVTTHYALIPLGRLPKGEFCVNIKQLPPKSVDGERASLVADPERIVCSSFSFRVRE